MNSRQKNSPNASALRIAFIQSAWHKELLSNCYTSFLNATADYGPAHTTVELIEVPGAFEIPLHAKFLAKQGKYAAIVASGLIVDGGIYRHDFVGQAVITGLMQVQLETEIPVFSAVLTPHHFHEHEAHKTFFCQHLRQKGLEVAAACFRTLQNLEQLRQASNS